MRSFDDVRDAVIERATRLHAALDGRETVAAFLFLEVRDGSTAPRPFRVVGLDDAGKDELARVRLPQAIRTSRARRFGWLMPAYRHDVEPPVECLVAVVADRDRAEALVADVVRGADSATLGPWRGGVRDVSGLFVDACREALVDDRG